MVLTKHVYCSSGCFHNVLCVFVFCSLHSCECVQPGTGVYFLFTIFMISVLELGCSGNEDYFQPHLPLMFLEFWINGPIILLVKIFRPLRLPLIWRLHSFMYLLTGKRTHITQWKCYPWIQKHPIGLIGCFSSSYFQPPRTIANKQW